MVQSIRAGMRGTSEASGCHAKECKTNVQNVMIRIFIKISVLLSRQLVASSFFEF